MQASGTAPQTMDLVHHRGPFSNLEEAAAAARRIMKDMALEGPWSPLEVIGQFVVPPVDVPQRRDFQTMHFDFGLPLDPGRPVDVARCTALHMPAELAPSAALTRSSRSTRSSVSERWVPWDSLLARFVAYGASHGAWDHTVGYVEGSLARLVEAASGDAPILPSVSADPDFLCGHEFAELDAESVFFADRGLDLMQAQIEIALQPGELLVFDNLRLAHGRRGVRRPGELRQVVFGHRALDRKGQAEVRDMVLRAFAAGETRQDVGPRLVKSRTAGPDR